MTDFAPYVGIPWKWGGYDKAGTFCWGLLWMVQREVFGREAFPKLPHGKAETFSNAGETVRKWALAEMDPKPIDLKDAQAGDVIRLRGTFRAADEAEIHVGVFVDPKRVLHTEENTGSIIERVDSRRFAWRIVQAYRLA